MNYDLGETAFHVTHLIFDTSMDPMKFIHLYYILPVCTIGGEGVQLRGEILAMLLSAAWKIGGEQGQGIDSSGDLFARACNRLGYYVYGYKEFSSRIQGGHSNYKIRIGTGSVASTSSDLHVLVAIDQESIDRNAHELVEGGFLIADAAFQPEAPAAFRGRLIAAPMTDMARDVGNPKVKNVVALGISAYLLGLPLEAFSDVLDHAYGRHGEAVVRANQAALNRGFAFAAEHVLETRFRMAPGDGRARMLMIGNEAVALGALAAGCRVMPAYPITPASEIMEWLQRELPRFGGVVVQCEDEIAALTTAIGAGIAGARAMTATAGPGLSLMQEAIGLAQTAEVPVVIVDCQRGGPSTGMPTKHEQSDVLAVMWGSHGETPRIVLAPSSVEEAFWDTVHAFNLAERYQCPVFVVLDLSLSLNKQSVEGIDFAKVTIDRGERVKEGELEILAGKPFARYRVTESGVSPRTLPGQKGGQYVATGLEHDEFGKVSEDPKNRKAMHQKRLRKVSGVDLSGLRYTGDEQPEILLVGFGSTDGAIEEARKEMGLAGISCGHAHVRILAPFPTFQLAPAVERAQAVVVVENNATGQLETLMRAFMTESMGRKETEKRLHSIRKYDGRPFLPEEIAREAAEVLGVAKVS